MPIFEYKGIIDPKTWKPEPLDGDWTIQYSKKLWKQMKSVSMQLRRYGIEGYTKSDGSLRQPGYTVILNFLYETFPDVTPENKALKYKFPSIGAVDKWTSGMEFVLEEPDYRPKDVPRQWRSYVARLSMISEFWHQRPLTGNEAIVAQYVGSEFQDPFGDEVDLIPQLAVLRQIASAEAMKANHVLEAFEDYFTYAPWKFGKDLYVDNANAKGQHIPILNDFMMFVSPSENWRDVSPVFEDALRQLGMSYTAFYWSFEGDGTAIDHFPSLPHYGDEAKGKCNWQTILKSRTSEDQAELMEPLDVLDLDDERLMKLAEHSKPSGGLWTSDWSLRPWLKKDKWIQIQRIPYKGETND